MTRTGGILCTFAHPDDEQFGTAAALRSCVLRGIPVHIFCATLGDAGEISDPAFATRENLAEVRHGELITACDMLGFEPPMVLTYGDGKLPEVPFDQLVADIVTAIRLVKPRVLITFDSNGGYGHPDHIAIHKATLAAVPLAGDAAYRPEFGSAHAIDKLYATAFSRALFGVMEQGLRDLGFGGFDLGSVQTIPTSELGTPNELITTVVPALEHFDLRLAAMFAHRTQFGPESMFARFPEELTRHLMANDCFRRILPAPAEGAVLPDETDLWDGLEKVSA